MQPEIDWEFVFARQGSHIVAVPKLGFWLNWEFAGTDLRPLKWFNYLLTWLIFLGVVVLLRRVMKGDRFEYASYFFASLLSFSMSQWLLIFTGWGFCWLLLPLFLRLGMIVGPCAISDLKHTIILLVLSLLASMTLAAGFSLWLFFPIFLWMCGKFDQGWSLKKHLPLLLMWMCGAGLCFWMLSNNYGIQNSYEHEINILAQHDEREFASRAWFLTSPFKAVMYLFTLLGAQSGMMFRGLVGEAWGFMDGVMASFVGAMGLAALIGGVVVIWRSPERKKLMGIVAPWGTIAFMELAIAGLITIGRGGAGSAEHTFSSHYGMVGLQFQIGAWLTLYLALRDSKMMDELRASEGEQSFSWKSMFVCLLMVGFITLNVSHLAGHVARWKQIVDHSEAQAYRQSLEPYISAVAPRHMPPPYPKIGKERFPWMTELGVMKTLPEDEVWSRLEEAPGP